MATDRGVIASLLVSLGLDSSQFTTGLSKAERDAKKSMTAIVAAGTTIGVTIANALTQVAGMFKDLALESYQTKQALADMSTSSGIAVDRLDALRRVGLFTGTSLDEITRASTQMNRMLETTGNRGGAAARALKSLGISVEDFKGLAPDQQIQAVAKAMNGFADGTGKSTAAMMLFGRSGSTFLRFLKELGEQQEIFGKETHRSAWEAKALGDQLTALGLHASDFAAGLASSVIPKLTEFIRQLNESRSIMGGWNEAFAAFSLGINPLVGTESKLASLEKELAREQEMLAHMQKNYDKYAAARKRLDEAGEGERSSKDIATVINHAMAERELKNQEEAVATAEKKLQFIRNKREREVKASLMADGYEDAGRRRTEGRRPQVDIVDPDGGARGAAKKREAEQYLDSLNKQIEALTQRNALEQLEYDLSQNKLKDMLPGEEKLMRVKAEQIVLGKRQLDQLRAEAQQEEDRKRWMQAQEEAKQRRIEQDARILADWRAANVAAEDEVRMLGMSAQEQRKYNLAKLEAEILRKEGLLTMRMLEGEEEDSLERLREEIRLMRERLSIGLGGLVKQDQLDAAEEALRRTAENAERTMTDSIAQGIMDGFRQGNSMADVFLRELKAQFARTVLAPILQPITAAGNDMIGGLMNGILGLFGQQIPAPVETRVLPTKSGGGPVSANSLYRVNEMRTEGLKLNGEQFLLMGSQGGSIDSAPRVGASVNVYQTNNLGSNVSRNEVAAAMVAAKETAKAEIFQALRTNRLAYGMR